MPESELRSQFRDWYNEIAEGSDNCDKFTHHLQRQLRGLTLDGKKILEVGCGKGAVSLYLALFERVGRVVALDEAAGEGGPVGVTAELERAVDRFTPGNLEVVNADIMENGYPDAAFDLIIANRVLHHVVDSGYISRDAAARRDYLRVLAELKRLLVPGGMLLVAEISRISFWRWSPIRLRQRNIGWPIHPTRRELLEVVREAGFALHSFDYIVPYRLRRLRPLLARPWAQFFLGPNFVIGARK